MTTTATSRRVTPTPGPASTARVTRERPPRAARVALVAVTVVLLAACSTVQGAVDTAEGIARATGTSDISVSIDNPLDRDAVRVGYATDLTEPQAVRDQAREVARVVWTEFPFRFDTVELEPRGAGVGTVTYDRGELEEAFGPRDPDLDQDLSDAAGGLAAGVLAVIGVVLLVVLGVVVLVIVLIVRASRRRRERDAQGGWGGPSQHGGWGEPQQQGGWSPPSQQGGWSPSSQQGGWAPPSQPSYGPPGERADGDR